jgi:hypothetical protein
MSLSEKYMHLFMEEQLLFESDTIIAKMLTRMHGSVSDG